MRERVAVLGSTGSVGINTLDVISRLSDRFEVLALAADSNIALLSKQARRFHPKAVSVGTSVFAQNMKRCVPSGTRVLYGMEGLRAIAARPDVDTVVFAISGSACILPLIDAIKVKKKIALANKESLVSAGQVIMALAKQKGVSIIPIDSEHSAIFQCICGNPKGIKKLYLTGSGGPLLDIPKNSFNKLPVGFILNHPKWKMGKKISVDSATMMNKGLEIIEAKHLFDVEERDIEVLVHPEAVIHSMVEFDDNSVIAQLANPDMRLPIQYALTYPDRLKSPVRQVDFSKTDTLSFRRPDTNKFPCLELAVDAARRGGTAGAVLCASDEEAVKRYLDGKISFTDIPKVIAKVLSRSAVKEDAGLNVSDILAAEAWAREEAQRICCR